MEKIQSRKLDSLRVESLHNQWKANRRNLPQVLWTEVDHLFRSGFVDRIAPRLMRAKLKKAKWCKTQQFITNMIADLNHEEGGLV